MAKRERDPREERYKAGGGRGRKAAKPQLVDTAAIKMPIRRGILTVEQFISEVVKEMKIRMYSPNTIKNYRSQLVAFFRWFGAGPNRARREHVREYLLLLVETGASRSRITSALAALRTSFDDFFCQEFTVGFVTPRTRKKLPATIGADEVKRTIDACTRTRDKLLVALIYATGMRVSEISRLKWQDLDFERNLVHVRQGKGAADRQVSMPRRFRPVLENLANLSSSTDWVFPGEGDRKNRHLSPRTVQRVISKAAQLAGINRNVTPHVLRHAFATHLFESGTDIRLIQKLLGHVNLETTCIYVKVARNVQQSVPSPLDQIPGNSVKTPTFDFAVHTRNSPECQHTKITLSIQGRSGIVYFTGIIAIEVRPGFWGIQLPTLERWRQPLREIGARSKWFDEPTFYTCIRDKIIQICTVDSKQAKLEHALT